MSRYITCDPSILEATVPDPRSIDPLAKLGEEDVNRLVRCLKTLFGLFVAMIHLPPAQFRDLKACILRRDATEEEIAKAIDTSQQAVSYNLRNGWDKLESGRFQVRVLVEINSIVEEFSLIDALDSDLCREVLFPERENL